MNQPKTEITIRPHQRSDTDAIAAMINRDPHHLYYGVDAASFEQILDEPGERIRDKPFVVCGMSGDKNTISLIAAYIAVFYFMSQVLVKTN